MNKYLPFMSRYYGQERINKGRVQQILLGITVLLFFILIFLLNRLYPLYADDWAYIYDGMSFGEAITVISAKLYDQYLHWGGRTVVHFIAHILSWGGTQFSNIVNSAAFVLYLYIVYRISNKGKATNAGLLGILGLILWFVLPAINSTVLWLVGAANYMWGTIIVILFLYPYYSYYIDGKQKNGFFHILLFILGGIIAGWTNENLFVAEVFFIICLFLLLRKSKKTIPGWAIAGLAGVCIGGILMIAAPGNYIRAEVVKEGLDMADKPFLQTVAYRIMKTGYRYAVYILPISVGYLVTFFFYKKYTGIDKKTLYGSLLFFLSGHIACAAMAASFIFPVRATFGIITLIVTGWGILLANPVMVSEKLKNIKYIVIGILISMFAVSYGLYYRDIRYLSEEFAKREEYLNRQKETGNRYIIFENSIRMPDKYQFEDLSDDPMYWLNTGYAAFFEVDSVKVIDTNTKTETDKTNRVK